MALDRQRILGELGSVMKQLQNADCGCLGKLFGNSQQAAPSMIGSPLPTCGGCRRGCCHGHGCSRYHSPTRMNQTMPNMNYMSLDSPNPPQQSSTGNMYGFGPQIVNMMRGDQTNSNNMTKPAQGQMSGQLTGPMVIDAPQSPHGKVGLTPFTPPAMPQQGQFKPAMNQGDITGQMQNKFIPEHNTNRGNTGNMTSWPQQSMSPHAAVRQTHIPHINSHGLHSEGIAKFNNMFPGIKQGMGGDLGFDPMAIAIQMNPENHLHSAMDTMNKIMYGNKGTDQMFNKVLEPQAVVTGNTMNQSPGTITETTQQNADSGVQGNVNSIADQQPTSHNVVPNQGSLNQDHTPNVYGQPIPQQNQHIYATTVDPIAANPQVRREENQQLPDNQQYEQQQIINPNSAVPKLPIIHEDVTAQQKQFEVPPPVTTGYPNQRSAQQMIKEPIFPADPSKNVMYLPTKQVKDNNYVYNTLGQPVEMLPAKMYHPPEPSLPQTLSPQTVPEKLRPNPTHPVHVKAIVSKTSLMGNKRAGKTPSRSQLQHIYNQYKGSQSYTQQNVRQPGEGTSSDGRLNVPQATKAPPVPLERVGGDTVVNNPPSNQDRTNKVEEVMGRIGDVPAAKPAGDSLPLKGAPVPIQKCRNGLQDMVFSAYPTSTAWSFHGHGRNDLIPRERYRHRQY